MLRIVQLAVVLFSLLLIPATAFAQRDRDTYTVGPQALEVTGHVRLAENGESAREIPVRLERFSGGLVDQMSTDSRGKFRFSNIPRGYYKIVINAQGFRPAQQEADLQVVSRVFLVFDLTREKAASSSGGLLLNDIIDARVPVEAQKEFARGRTALAARNADVAITHLEKAIFLYSQYFEAQLLLATAHMDKRQWEKAESVLQRALEIKPDSAAVFIAMGEVSWRQKQYADAERLLLEGLKRDDKSWHGYFTLGRLYLDQGEMAKAGPPIGKTLQLKPDFAEAHLLAGNILLHFKQKERALVEYQEYLRLAPKGEFANQANDLVRQLTKAIADNRK